MFDGLPYLTLKVQSAGEPFGVALATQGAAGRAALGSELRSQTSKCPDMPGRFTAFRTDRSASASGSALKTEVPSTKVVAPAEAMAAALGMDTFSSTSMSRSRPWLVRCSRKTRILSTACGISAWPA